MKPRLRPGAAAAIAALALLVAASPAQAHAFLVRTQPADGTALRQPPRTLTLRFSEDVSASLTRVQLIAAGGRPVAGVSVEPGSGRTVTVALPRLPHGTYRIAWRTVSTDDLHTTAGDTVFGVGVRHVAPAASAVADPTPPAGSVAMRWVDFSAIAALIGPLAILLWVLPAARRRGAGDLAPARRRMLAVSAGAAAAAILTGAGLLLEQASALPGPLLAAARAVLTGTSFGPRFAAREAILVALLGIVGVLARRPGARWARAAAGGLAAALLIVLALMGHAPAASGAVSLATAAMALHLLAAAVWTGGLAAAAAAVLPLLRRAPATARSVMRAFGDLAAVSMAALVATGLYELGVQVATLPALTASTYGRTMIVKTAFVCAAGAAGLVNAALVRRRGLPGRSLPRVVALEAVLAVAVLVPAAALTATAPARGPRYDPPAAVSAPATRYVHADDLIFRVSLKPARPGPNFVTVGILETRLPAPAPIATVRISGQAQPLRRATDGTWTGTATIRRPGAWPFSIDVRRPGLPDVVAPLRWPVQPAAAAVAAPGAAGARMRPLAAMLALAIALAAAAAVGVLAARRVLPVRWQRLRTVPGRVE